VGVVATLDANYGRLQGCSGQDANHGHSHLIAFGGNNTQGPIEISTAVQAHGSYHGDFECETFVAVVGFNWQNGGGYGNANDGLGITEEGTGPLSRSQVPAVAQAVCATGEVFHTLRADGFDASKDGTGRGAGAVVIGTPLYECKACGESFADPYATGVGGLAPAECPRCGEERGVVQAVAFQQNTRDEVRLIGGDGQIVGALAADSGMKQTNYVARPEPGQIVEAPMQVRRLTPTECERLQGFPDGYTLVPYRGKPAADGPRYKGIGNSMAVPVMAWIGRRIDIVDKIMRGS
jgi:DNA (cytosine-5)-methyltransferase 1